MGVGLVQRESGSCEGVTDPDKGLSHLHEEFGSPQSTPSLGQWKQRAWSRADTVDLMSTLKTLLVKECLRESSFRVWGVKLCGDQHCGCSIVCETAPTELNGAIVTCLTNRVRTSSLVHPSTVLGL